MYSTGKLVHWRQRMSKLVVYDIHGTGMINLTGHVFLQINRTGTVQTPITVFQVLCITPPSHLIEEATARYMKDNDVIETKDSVGLQAAYAAATSTEPDVMEDILQDTELYRSKLKMLIADKCHLL